MALIPYYIFIRIFYFFFKSFEFKGQTSERNKLEFFNK